MLGGETVGGEVCAVGCMYLCECFRISHAHTWMYMSVCVFHAITGNSVVLQEY